jgi:hypothetical protein
MKEHAKYNYRTTNHRLMASVRFDLPWQVKVRGMNNELVV